MANIVSSIDDHLITLEDVQSGVLWHFAAGKTKGFRFINGQPHVPGGVVPTTASQSYVAAEKVAKDLAVENGWI